MSVAVVPPAVRALDEVVAELRSAGLEASRDPGAFYPQPVGILVGLPALVGRTMAARTYEISVLVVSGDPLNAPANVDRLYALVDDAALVLHVDAYRPSNWRSSVNAEPLPAVELTATVTVNESEVP